MRDIDTDKIRNIANWLRSTSVSSNGNPSTPMTKRDLENLRNNIAKAIAALADVMDA